MLSQHLSLQSSSAVKHVLPSKWESTSVSIRPITSAFLPSDQQEDFNRERVHRHPLLVLFQPGLPLPPPAPFLAHDDLNQLPTPNLHSKS